MPALTVRVYVNVNGKDVLWSEKDSKGNKKCFLSAEDETKYIKAICNNISKGMTEYVQDHPDSVLLN